MSDENKMHSLLGKFFAKQTEQAETNSAKTEIKAEEKIEEKTENISAGLNKTSENSQSDSNEDIDISDELFSELVADLLDDSEEQTVSVPETPETLAQSSVAEETPAAETTPAVDENDLNTEKVSSLEDELAEGINTVEKQTLVAEIQNEVKEDISDTSDEVDEAVAAVRSESEFKLNAAVFDIINRRRAAEASKEPVYDEPKAPVVNRREFETVQNTTETEPVEGNTEATAANAETETVLNTTVEEIAAEPVAEIIEATASKTETVINTVLEESGAEPAKETDAEPAAEPVSVIVETSQFNNENIQVVENEEIQTDINTPDNQTATDTDETVLQPEESAAEYVETAATEENETGLYADASEEKAEEIASIFDSTDKEDRVAVVHTEEKAETPSIDPEDAMLMSALGYTDTDIAESASKQAKRTVNAGKQYSDLDNAFAYDGREYRSKDQDSKIISNYADDKRLLFFRLIGTGLFALLLFIYDILGNKFGGALSHIDFPVVNILISLQLLLLCAVFSFKSIIRGFKGIFNARPINDSITAAVVLMTCLYDIILAVAAPTEFTLYNFPAAFCLIMSIVADWLKLRRETETFKRLSSFNSVCTLEKITTPGNEDKESTTYRLKRGSFASNYFRHINKCSFPPVFIYVILFGTALAFVLFFIRLAAASIDDGNAFVKALNVFIAVIQFAMPSFAIASYAIPFYVMMSRKIDSNAVILHESDTQDYDRVGTVVLDEQEIFSENSIKINGIKNCTPGTDYFDTLAATASIFRRVGGTISHAFRSISESTEISLNAEKIKVCDGGVEADVNGIHYVIGTADFLGKHWINCPDTDNRRYLSGVRGGMVLYIAADGVTVLKLNMQYALDSVSVGLIGSLSEKNIRTIFRCQDPFITSDLLSELIGITDFKAYVVRTDGPEEDDEVYKSSADEIIDSGLIADGVEWVSAIKAANACGLYRKWNKLGFYISSAVICLGVLLACFLGGFGAVVGMPSFYIVLFQILSVLPTVVMSKLIFD